MRVDSLKQIYIYQQVSQIIVIFCNLTTEEVSGQFPRTCCNPIPIPNFHPIKKTGDTDCWSTYMMQFRVAVTKKNCH